MCVGGGFLHTPTARLNLRSSKPTTRQWDLPNQDLHIKETSLFRACIPMGFCPGAWMGHMDGVLPRHMDEVLSGDMDEVLTGHI